MDCANSPKPSGPGICAFWAAEGRAQATIFVACYKQHQCLRAACKKGIDARKHLQGNAHVCPSPRFLDTRFIQFWRR